MVVTFIGIVLMCNLTTGVCDMGVMNVEFPTPEACYSVLNKVLANEQSKLPVPHTFANDEQTMLGWCEPKGLPWIEK